MRKLITLLIMVGILIICYFLCYGANKDVIYDNATNNVVGVVVQIINTEDGRVNIKLENKRMIYGANTDKVKSIAIDEKIIPADLLSKPHMVNAIEKYIYEPITIEYISVYKIKNIKKEIIGRLTLSSGTTYNIYNMKGTKLGTYKASVKLTITNIKGKEFKLIKLLTGYTIKE